MIAVIFKVLSGFGNLIGKLLLVQVPFLVVLLGIAGTYWIVADPLGDEQVSEPTYLTAIDTVWVQGETAINWDTTVVYKASPPFVLIEEDTTYLTIHDTVWVKITSSGEINADTTVESPTEKIDVFTRALWPSGRVYHRFKFQPYPVKEKRWLFAFGAGVDFTEKDYVPFLLADINYRGIGIGGTLRESSYGFYLRKGF